MSARKIKAKGTDLVVCDPEIMMGKPTIKGTRITVELILEKLSAGETTKDLLESHPRLTREGISSALDYASRVLRTDLVEPLPEKKHAVRRR